MTTKKVKKLNRGDLLPHTNTIHMVLVVVIIVIIIL